MANCSPLRKAACADDKACDWVPGNRCSAKNSVRNLAAKRDYAEKVVARLEKQASKIDEQIEKLEDSMYRANGVLKMKITADQKKSVKERIASYKLKIKELKSLKSDGAKDITKLKKDAEAAQKKLDKALAEDDVEAKQPSPKKTRAPRKPRKTVKKEASPKEASPVATIFQQIKEKLS
eukprot:764955-Hanusia_phi.AAC.5